MDAVDFGQGGSARKNLIFWSGAGSRARAYGRREGDDEPANGTPEPTGGGGVNSDGNETAGDPLRKIENSTCMSMYDIEWMCKSGLISRVRTLFGVEGLGFISRVRTLFGVEGLGFISRVTTLFGVEGVGFISRVRILFGVEGLGLISRVRTLLRAFFPGCLHIFRNFAARDGEGVHIILTLLPVHDFLRISCSLRLEC